MNEIKVNYDQEADILYVSFERSQHVTGIELTDNIVLRIDTGKTTNTPPRAVGLTFINFARLIATHRDQPLIVSVEKLRHLPSGLWQVVFTLLTTPPVSDFLATNLAIIPRVPPLPEGVATRPQ
jgi:hypothetical protein